jgi:hypothetical protein
VDLLLLASVPALLLLGVWPCVCVQYDKDESGTIDFEEFLDMAKVLVGSRTNFRESLPWKYGSGARGQQGLGPQVRPPIALTPCDKAYYFLSSKLMPETAFAHASSRPKNH